MQVVQANTSHVEFLAQFGAESFINAYQCTLPHEALKEYVEAAFSESIILDELQDSTIRYSICLDMNHQPCGYAKLIEHAFPGHAQTSDSIELQRLYIASDCRGQGAGKQLESYAIAQAMNENLKIIWLRVWDGNIVARDIYQQWGYVVGDEPYEVGDERRTVLLMQKTLRSG